MIKSYVDAIVYSNIIPLIILGIFIMLIFYNPTFNKKQSRLFLYTASISIFMIIVISIDNLLTRVLTPEYAFFRTITTFLNFAVSPTLSILLCKISDPTKTSKWFYVPFLINLCLCIISIPTGIIFSVSDMNHYSRGLLFFVPFTISIFYIFFLMVHSRYIYMKNRFIERVFLIIIIVVLAIALFSEIILGYRFFTWTAAAVTLPLYYLLLNINQSILDPLTKAYNRIMYSNDIENINHTQPCVIALLDINNFKTINDQYGHDIGDQYLIQFVKVMNQHLIKQVSLYRIGGDEFVIIAKKSKSIDKIVELIDNARKELENNHLYFSYGIDIYNTKDNIEDFLIHIDTLMYENKKKDKALKKEIQSSISTS